MISMAKELRDVEMGFRIEMDDFGTGYSSLGMLSSLPIDALKLDMSFVRNAFGENRDFRMIELIIDIADYLHVPVVAEGVETEEQYLVLRAMGCDYVQGYYFSRPVPPEDFDKFLIGRADANYKITPSTKKAHMSISRALTTDFESIYYVDVTTDDYLEFRIDANGDLEILPGGNDFFKDVRAKLLRGVREVDLPKLEEATSKARLTQAAKREEAVRVSFVRLEGESPIPCSLQTIRTRESDCDHVLIGVKRAKRPE